jgi:glycosyltransferase involved in cell wall biosynthesis
LRKIVFISYANFPFGGAMANFSRYFVTGLAAQNDKIEVILPTGNYFGNNIDSDKNREGSINGVVYKHLCFINHPRNYIGKLIDNICGLILPILYLVKKSIKRDLDIIIICDSDFVRTLLFVATKSVLRKNLVIILPEFYEKPKGWFLSLSVINWYSFYFGMRFVIKYADGFIVLTNFMKNYIREELHCKKGILIVPNLTDPKKFERQNVKPFSENKITIGYTGTPTQKDGILDLIKSFSALNKRYKNIHLLIIGDLTNGKTMIPALKEYASDLGVLEKISFTGLISHNRIPDLLNSCQILALTRPNGIFAEAGFPTKLSEYFACKKPVLITSVGDIPKYFKDQEHVILAEPGNIESIAAGFEFLLNNKVLAKEISINGYNWMEQNTNYINISPNISQFLHRLNLPSNKQIAEL